MWFFKKTNPRRSQVRKSKTFERSSQINWLADTDTIISILLWLLFTILCTFIISFKLIQQVPKGQAHYRALLSLAVIVMLICAAAGLYIRNFQNRIIKNHLRAIALCSLFIVLLAATKLGMLLTGHNPSISGSYTDTWATGTAVAAAIILAISYNQRFAMGMSIFYCLLAFFAAVPTMNMTEQLANPATASAFAETSYQLPNINLFLIMAAGAMTCSFLLKEIRTRMKLIEVITLAAGIVFITTLALNFLTEEHRLSDHFRYAGYHSGTTFVVGILIQGLLPLLEKVFRIATGMTLLDYSDANQPLLKKLAMEAPGTFSHSLLIGSVAEAAAEGIGRNGLLCRVGAYYHDIGKINKPNYFIENQMGLNSPHKELSPTISQLIIVGHIKDGIEMAKEYGLPAVLRQFIETHHGTTLVEPFYNEAIKKHEVGFPQGGFLPAERSSKRKHRQTPPSESEFRYAGPKPRTKEAAIVMLADSVEGTVRSLPEATPTKIEAVVHNMAMKRLQDGQFDECDITLRELNQVEASMSKTLAAHYHGRMAYPKAPDEEENTQLQPKQTEQKKQLTGGIS